MHTLLYALAVDDFNRLDASSFIPLGPLNHYPTGTDLFLVNTHFHPPVFHLILIQLKSRLIHDHIAHRQFTQFRDCGICKR